MASGLARGRAAGAPVCARSFRIDISSHRLSCGVRVLVPRIGSTPAQACDLVPSCPPPLQPAIDHLSAFEILEFSGLWLRRARVAWFHESGRRGPLGPDVSRALRSLIPPWGTTLGPP
eukprot:tig00020592_g11658.t1